MSPEIQFETPENIQVAYQPAGLGTRFVAWVVDTILITFLSFAIFIGLLCTGVVGDQALRQLGDAPGEDFPEHELPMYFIGLIILFLNLGSLLYYGCSELFLRGQTFGKRRLGIRVVKVDGFALDAGGILVRTFFRLIDHMPPLWVVPVVSQKSQRLGDMVAGTVVVTDKPDQISDLREVFAQRSAAESKFRFDATVLKRARPQDVHAIEGILERWSSLGLPERELLLKQVVAPLARRLQVDPPETEDRYQFLEDFLAAEFRRQHKKLG